MPSAPGSLTCQSGTVPTFQNFSENEGTVGGKRVAGTCSSPVRAPCWSQGSDFLSGPPLGEHGVCRPSLGRELRVWDVWAQRWGRSRPRWALQAEVLSVTVAGARRCHGKETTEASARGGRGCQRPPGQVGLPIPRHEGCPFSQPSWGVSASARWTLVSDVALCGTAPCPVGWQQHPWLLPP